jgi:hypothetical protein
MNAEMRQALFDNPITGKPSISIGCQRSLLPLGEKKHNVLRCISYVGNASSCMHSSKPPRHKQSQSRLPARQHSTTGQQQQQQQQQKRPRSSSAGRISADGRFRLTRPKQTQNAFLCPAIDPTKLDTFSVVSIDCSQRCSSFPPPHLPPCQTPPPSWPARSLPSSNRPLSVVPSTLLPPTWLSRPTLMFLGLVPSTRLMLLEK